MISFLPDFDYRPPVMLVDPRYSTIEIQETINAEVDEEACGVMDIGNSWLLPATVETDSLSCFASNVYHMIANLPILSYNKSFLSEVFCLITNIEDIIVNGKNLDDAYEGVEKLKKWRPDYLGSSAANSVRYIAGKANMLLDGLSKFPHPKSRILERDEPEDIGRFNPFQ